MTKTKNSQPNQPREVWEIECCFPVAHLHKRDIPDIEPLGLSGVFGFLYRYPLAHEVIFKHKLTPKMSAKDIILIASKDYKRIYREEDQDVGKPTPMYSGTFNRRASQGRHGIWGHVIDDLVYECVHIDPQAKLVWFSIGS